MIAPVARTTVGRALRELLRHPLADRQRRTGDYHRVRVIDQGDHGYCVALLLDGGYAHPRDAEDARAFWQRDLDNVLHALDLEDQRP